MTTMTTLTAPVLKSATPVQPEVIKIKGGMKGDIVSAPEYRTLDNRSVTTFRFRRYNLFYTVKLYSNLGQGNTALKTFNNYVEGDEIVLYNAKYVQRTYTNKDDIE